MLLLLVLAPVALRSAAPALAEGNDTNDASSEHGHAPGASTAYFDVRSVGEARRDARASRGTAGTVNLANQGGGRVMTDTHVYVIFWGWGCNGTGTTTCDQAVNYNEDFYNGVLGSGWLNSVSQYCGLIPAGTSTCSGLNMVGNPLRGATFIFDNANKLPSRISQSSIANEASRVAASNGGGGVNNLYIVMTPHGRSQSGFGTQWCGYHSYTGSGTPYAYIPYQPDAGYSCGANSVGSAFDGFSIVGGHEVGEAMTDPLLNAWYDSTGAENGDKCAWKNLTAVVLANGKNYSVQPLWSNKTSTCVTSF